MQPTGGKTRTARPRIEQPQGKSFEGLTVKFCGENIEIARALQDLTKILSCVKFFPFVTACQGFLEFAIPDLPSTDQKVKIVSR